MCSFVVLIFFIILSNTSLKSQSADLKIQHPDSFQNNTIKNASILYLGHSGWALETQNYLLVFDPVYAKPNFTNYDNKNIFVFISHVHSDHYSKNIFNWKEDVQNIKYIFGWHPKIRSNKIKPACIFCTK